jgi:diacylglycerol kinase family enzyme
MYYYIIDPQKIDQRKFERVQNQLYSSVAQLKISGEMSRVTPLRSVRQLVDTAVMRGATTIVAVGHDGTVQEVIDAVGEKDLAIGYVPVQDSEMSRVLGQTDVETACRNLAQRRTELLDLGKINSHYFFTKVGICADLDSVRAQSVFDFTRFAQAAALKPVPVSMEVDGEYVAEFEVAIGAVFNSRAAKCDERIADPTDGVLDVLLLPGITAMDAWKYRMELGDGCLERIPGCAVVHGRRIVIRGGDSLPFFLDGHLAAKAPAVIEVVPKKVRMIMGKDRLF